MLLVVRFLLFLIFLPIVRLVAPLLVFLILLSVHLLVLLFRAQQDMHCASPPELHTWKLDLGFSRKASC